MRTIGFIALTILALACSQKGDRATQSAQVAPKVVARGASLAEVESVLGEATRREGPSEPGAPVHLKYKSNQLTFEDGKLVGWLVVPEEIRVEVDLPGTRRSFITPDSTLGDVIALMGPPHSWGNAVDGGAVIEYRTCILSFEVDGRIRSVSTYYDEIVFSLGEPNPQSAGFGFGAAQSEVIAAMGSPRAWSRYSNGESFVYDLSDRTSVHFSNAQVVKGWDNMDGKLKLDNELSAKPGAASIVVGSSTGDVLAAMGPPAQFDENIWRYGDTLSSSITFDNNRVITWKNPDNILKVE